MQRVATIVAQFGRVKRQHGIGGIAAVAFKQSLKNEEGWNWPLSEDNAYETLHWKDEFKNTLFATEKGTKNSGGKKSMNDIYGMIFFDIYGKPMERTAIYHRVRL